MSLVLTSFLLQQATLIDTHNLYIYIDKINVLSITFYFYFMSHKQKFKLDGTEYCILVDKPDPRPVERQNCNTTEYYR